MIYADVSVPMASRAGAEQDRWVARVLGVDMQADQAHSAGPDKAALDKFRTKWAVARTRAFDEIDTVGAEVANVFQIYGIGQDFLADFNGKIEPLRRQFDDPLAPLLNRWNVVRQVSMTRCCRISSKRSPD